MTVPSFDVVSELDLQEVRNAVDQANRELATRYDFRGVEASFELLEGAIAMKALEEFQLEQMDDILRSKLVRRNIDVRCLDPGKVEASGKEKRQRLSLRSGIDKDHARDMVKHVKESKLKVQAAIQGDKLRITGKQRDDLQQAIASLKAKDFGIALQFDNFRD